MFFSDAFLNSKTTEPRWFKNIRIIIAIGLTITILFYVFQQIKVLSTYLNLNYNQYGVIITEEDFHASMPDVYFCSSNVQNYSILYFSNQPDITQQFEKSGYYEINPTDKEGCRLFRSNYTLLNPDVDQFVLFDITLAPTSSTTNTSFDLINYLNYSLESNDNVLQVLFGNITIYHDTIDGSNKPDTFPLNSYAFSYNFTLESSDCILINISPTIKKIFELSNSFMGFLGYSPDSINYDLNPSFQIFPKLSDDRRIQFAVKRPSYLRYETQTSEYTIGNTVSKIGGFYVAMSSVYILLFGMPKLSPWGILQKYVLICKPCRRSLKTKLAKRFVSSPGIPLSQKVSNRRNNATLDDRVQMLETILQEYYLDNYQWELLRRGALKYDKLQYEYVKLMKNIHSKEADELV